MKTYLRESDRLFNNKETVDNNYEPIPVSEMFGLYIGVTIGWTFSLIVMIIEVNKNKIYFRKSLNYILNQTHG